MEDRLIHPAVRLAFGTRGLALATIILAIGGKAACAQSSLRVVSAPPPQAPAGAEDKSTTSIVLSGANVGAPGAKPSDLYDHLFVAIDDGTAQPQVLPTPPTTVGFSGMMLPDITPIESEPRVPTSPAPTDFDYYYLFAAAMQQGKSQPLRVAAEPVETEQITPRFGPLVQSDRPVTPAPAPPQIDLDRNLSQNRLSKWGLAHFAPKTPQNEPAPDGSGTGSRSVLSSIAPHTEPPTPQSAAPETVAAAPTPIEFQPVDRQREPTPASEPIASSDRHESGASPSTLSMPVVASSQPERAAEPPSASASYLGDAISSGDAPCCNGDAQLSLACPYLPGQSGTHSICGVECGPYGAPCCERWEDARWIPWSLLGPGEYVGPARPEHVPAYYLRVNDLITLTYIVSRQKQPDRYRIGVGDRLRIESGFDETLDRELLVQPDGDIHLPLIGDVPAAGKSIQELREDLIRRFGRIERDPIITVTPLEFNTGLQEILNAVTSQSRLSGQAIDLRITPEGTIQAPGLGSVYVQGLAIEELRSELEARYAAMFGPGLLVSPALTDRATSYVFLGGEVVSPGRYTLEGPTTVMQAITLAGGWNNGGNTREIVVFRRDENWCLKATKINVHRPLYGKDPCPAGDVWLRDNDLVIVPKTRILCAADVIELYFTRGVYAVFPITFVKDFSTGSTLTVPVGP